MGRAWGFSLRVRFGNFCGILENGESRWFRKMGRRIPLRAGQIGCAGRGGGIRAGAHGQCPAGDIEV